MKATIWHNPACGTSRKTLAILENLSNVEVTVVEYLKMPPTAEKLAQLYRDAGITPQKGLRLRGTDAAERGLPDADDATVLAAMVADPILIERPLVETLEGDLADFIDRAGKKLLKDDAKLEDEIRKVVRQIAMELARLGTGATANTIRAGVTATPALMKIPEAKAVPQSGVSPSQLDAAAGAGSGGAAAGSGNVPAAQGGQGQQAPQGTQQPQQGGSTGDPLQDALREALGTTSGVY